MNISSTVIKLNKICFSPEGCPLETGLHEHRPKTISMKTALFLSPLWYSINKEILPAASAKFDTCTQHNEIQPAMYGHFLLEHSTTKYFRMGWGHFGTGTQEHKNTTCCVGPVLYIHTAGQRITCCVHEMWSLQAPRYYRRNHKTCCASLAQSRDRALIWEKKNFI